MSACTYQKNRDIAIASILQTLILGVLRYIFYLTMDYQITNIFKHGQFQSEENHILRFCEEDEKASLLVNVHIKRTAYIDIVSILQVHNGCTGTKIKF